MTWALITESTRTLVLESDDFLLLKNIQLTVSKSILLSLVKPGSRTFNLATQDIINNILFVKSVLESQQQYYQKINTEYADIAERELLVLEIRKKFLGHILDHDKFTEASIESEAADINSYKGLISEHEKLVCKSLYSLNYTDPLATIKQQFIKSISNPHHWVDLTDRHFVYGKITSMFIKDFK